MTERETKQADITISRDDIQRIVKSYGQRALQMGTLNEDGSLTIARDCLPDAAQGTVSDWGSVLKKEIQPLSNSFIDRVIETRRRKITELTRAVQDAPTEGEAKRNWRKLEHLIFGI